MKSKYLSLLAAIIFLASSGAYADWLDSDGILRKDDGRFSLMNQSDALKSCPPGTHLPTIRELASLSQASGAKGILEVDPSDPFSTPYRYKRVSAVNANGARDEFNFSSADYVRPSGDLGHSSFWSSSERLGVSGYSFVLDGASGDVAWTAPGVIFVAVRCVADQ